MKLLTSLQTESSPSPEHQRKKMICWILLLIKLSCCVCAPTFEVNATQSFYQAEEKQNVTLEWTFPPPADGSLTSLHATCLKGFSVLFELIEGVQVSEHQHGQLAGRVHCDTDVLKEGRLRLHVSSLRTEDSGTYECSVRTESGRFRGESLLNVSALTSWHKSEPGPETEPEGVHTETWAWIGFYVGLLVPSAVMYVCYIRCRLSKHPEISV